MGFSFPVVQKAVQRDIDRLGQRVGLVQLANIVGNSAGSLVAGLLLLDLLGTAGTLMLLVAIGLGFAGPADRRGAGTRWVYPPALLLVLGLVFFPPDHDFWRRLHGHHDRAGHRRRGQDRPQRPEDGQRAGRQALHPGPFAEPPAVRHRARLPGRHRAAHPSRAQARAGDRLGHRRHALRRRPASRHRPRARDRDRGAGHRHAAPLPRRRGQVGRRQSARAIPSSRS